MAQLKDFIISKVRIKILKIFLTNVQKIYYVRELVRMTGEEINAVRRELINMENVGMLYKEKRGNRLYYGFKKSYYYYPELLALVFKSTGLGKEIVKQKNRLGKLKYVIVSGKFIRNLPSRDGHVDILFVGDLVMQEVSALIEEAEKDYKKEINYSVITKEEFIFRKNRKDPFLTNILLGSRFILIGDEEELLYS